MANLETSYMGIKLANPVIAGASKLTGNIDVAKKIESTGAGAIVTPSLFEEQIRIEEDLLEDSILAIGGMHQTELSLPSGNTFTGPQQHIAWLRELRKNLSIPVIASLNASTPQTWKEWAPRLADTGVDGLELNFYSTPTKTEGSAATLEDEQINIVQEICRNCSIPVSVKISPFYNNPLNVMKRLSEAGAKGIVVFNRFFQPDLDIETGKEIYNFDFSTPMENRLPLRFTALAHGKISSDICASTGIQSGEDALKLILAGACCVQTVSALYRQGIGTIGEMTSSMDSWMDQHGYSDIASIKGKMDKKNSTDPHAFERAQYVRILLQSEKTPKDIL
jgi:dihydroorotate dehydrogenase (fumarate)